MNHSIQPLIERFWSGKLTTEEKRVLLQQISQEHPQWTRELEAEYQAALLQPEEGLQDAAYFQEQFNKLQHTISLRTAVDAPRVFRVTARRWWSAAAVLLVAAGIGTAVYFNNRTQTTTVAQQTITALPADTVQVIHLDNKEQHRKTLFLADGSELVMEPGAELSYQSTYGQQVRALELHAGKAFFKVAKDKRHPFSVTAGEVKVNALGTAFTVNKAGKRQVQVLLTEGVVSVHAGFVKAANEQNVILKPGQGLRLDGDKNLVQLIEPSLVAKPAAKVVASEKEREARNRVLQFEQQPLNQVFTTIENYYKVKIAFHEEEVAALWFTGSFKQGDPLSVVLGTICKLNRLTFRFEDGSYIISKK